MSMWRSGWLCGRKVFMGWVDNLIHEKDEERYAIIEDGQMCQCYMKFRTRIKGKSHAKHQITLIL